MTKQLAVLGLLSTMLVASAVDAQKGRSGAHPNPGPQAQTGGPASSKWDGTYKVHASSSDGALVCPGARDLRSAERDNPVVTVSKGKLKVTLSAYNPAVYHLHSQGCDDRDSKDADCVAMFAKIKDAGASLDQFVKLGELVLSIDKEGKVYGSITPKPLPLPDGADDEQKADVAKLTSIAVTRGELSMDDHGRNAAGLGKGKVGYVELSAIGGKHAATCMFDLKATDYKQAGYCAASGDACKSDGDCCNHNCVPATRSCR
jgi:hypothetical protein